MLGRIEDGERYGLSPDRFAEIFPPGHKDAEAYARAQAFAAEHRCLIDWWPATNEVFFTKLRR
jgi:hypothetical protein